MIFSQKDSRWAGMPLGTSPYKMGPYGCLTTAHAQALSIAGYEVDPGNVVTAFNAVGAYTDANYPAGAGLLLWTKVSSAFPQYHWHAGEGGRYRFVQVIATYISGRFEHWVLCVDGVFYDPLDGTSGTLKSNYRPTGTVRSADIDQEPVKIVEAVAETPTTVPRTHYFDSQYVIGVKATTNCRTEPSTRGGEGTVFTKLAPGHNYYVKGYIYGENVEGNEIWYITANNHYFSAYYSFKPNP